jgi:hypothetical protein
MKKHHNKNVAAKSLRNPIFKMKVVISKKVYSRKKSGRVLTD